MESLQQNTTIAPVWATLEGRKQVSQSQRFRSLNSLWNSTGNSTIKTQGPLMKLMKTYNPATFDEWKRVYLTCGRSWEQLNDQAKRWAAAADLPFDEALAHVIIHAVDETWTGARGEHIALDLLRKKLEQYDFDLVDDAMDAKYSIDIIVFKKGTQEIIGGIQVKPGSYFPSSFKPGQIGGGSAKQRYKDNNIRFLEDFGGAVYYMSLKDVKNDILHLIPLSNI